jgi:hypothetical protein
MSDTPRTDAREWDWHDDRLLVVDMIVDADFARQLERELGEMTKQRDHYKAACDQYSEDEALNMLAEARKQRDTLAEQCRALLDSDEAQKAWPLDGTRRAEKPSDTHSSATVTVKFRRLLAIHSALAAVKGGDA